jgi:hypothetical protein
MAKAVKKAKKPTERKKKQKVEMISVPLLSYLKDLQLMPDDDFDNPKLPVLFKLYQGSAMTKGGEEKIVKLIAKSMESYDYICKYIYDAVKLYEETNNVQDDIAHLNGLA